MTNLDSILKSRDITLPTNVHQAKAMLFPVVMYGCERWAIKKAECQRTDAFELRYWRRLFRVPWSARSSNQSILKEINPEYSLEGLMLKLKLQYSGYLMWRGGSLEKTLMLGKTEGGGEGDDRGWDGWMASPTQWTWVWASSRRWWRTGKPGALQSMGSQSWTRLSNWTTKHLDCFAVVKKNSVSYHYIYSLLFAFLPFCFSSFDGCLKGKLLGQKVWILFLKIYWVFLNASFYRWEIQLPTIRPKASSPDFEYWVLSREGRIKEMFPRWIYSIIPSWEPSTLGNCKPAFELPRWCSGKESACQCRR